MVIGTLALLWYFVMVAVMGAGQQLGREPEATKSCRTRGICMYGCMDRRMDGWMDGCTDGHTDFPRSLSPPVPSGAVAQKGVLGILSWGPQNDPSGLDISRTKWKFENVFEYI